MTHYVITLDWSIVEWEEQASKIVGIAHSEADAYKIFDSQLVKEQDFAEVWNMKTVELTPTYFEARDEKDNFVCLYIQQIDSKDDDEKENNPMNELFERLMNGETEEEIVADFTSKLNEAIHEKEVEEAKKNNEAQKLEDTRELIAYIENYFSKYYPKLNTSKITAEDFVETLELLCDSFQGLENLFKIL